MRGWCASRWIGGLVALVLLGGCSTVSTVLTVAGVATDTSVTWEIAKHFHQKLTEGDPVPCGKLNTVQRALTPRCGDFEPGSLVAEDVAAPGLQDCALVVAAREPRLWAVLPELLDKGARPQACDAAPWVELAQAHPCPDFSAATQDVRDAFVRIARADARSIHHDVIRLMTCPSARESGLDRLPAEWLAQGRLPAAGLAFSPLAALHPDALDSPLARALEAHGHRARDGQGAYHGRLPSGFEEALRTSHWAALEWWLARVPEWVNRVPPRDGQQVAWVPLQQVMVPAFMPDAEQRRAMVEFLLARGADPWQRLPGQPQHTVISYAQWLQSPLAALLAQPAGRWVPKTAVASTHGRLDGTP